jgi:hypothetical protein
VGSQALGAGGSPLLANIQAFISLSGQLYQPAAPECLVSVMSVTIQANLNVSGERQSDSENSETAFALSGFQISYVKMQNC